MGAAPSSKPADEGGNPSYFSSWWLCGGGDAVDEDATTARVRRDPRARHAELRRAKADDAARLTESADLFLDEFRATMRQRGFAAVKYSRSGRAAPRLLTLDSSGRELRWKTRKKGGGAYDALLLSNVSDVSRGGDARGASDDRRALTIRAPPKRLVVGFDTEQRCRMFADGLALLVAEAKAAAPPPPAAAADVRLEAAADDDATARTVKA